MQPIVVKLSPAAELSHGARRREQILDAAVHLFAEHGYTDTDMQLLADTLQIGKGTLYRYFPSKQDLFLAAVDRIVRRLRERTLAAIDGVEDPLERIKRAIHAYLAFFAERPHSVELLIQERAQFKDRKKPTYFAYRDVWVQGWRDLYRTLIAEGRVRDVPVERITDIVHDLLYGVIFTNYFTGPRKPADEQARDVTDIVFHGILRQSRDEGRGTTVESAGN
jgi:AcrR family transcriptional regulator